MPAGSLVAWAQGRLHEAVRHALAAVAADVQAGLSETVGVEAAWCDEDPASIVVRLPADFDAKRIARAIDLENIEAWCDAEGIVHVGIHPFHSVKDTDQVVLAITKVLHALYGLHAPSGIDATPHAHPHITEEKLTA